MKKSLYEELVEAGIETDNYCSDLYFPVSNKSKKILEKHITMPSTIVSFFTHNVFGGIWYSVFAAYTPYWDKRKKK